MKKKIYFISASDRINFGDILFPLIFQQYLDKNKFDFENFAFLNSDLNVYGSLKTKSYKEFIKEVRVNDKNGVEGTIVLGGGEVLFTRWQTLLVYVSSFYNKLTGIPYLSKILEKLKLDKIIFNQVVKYPFAPTKKELQIKNTKIAFNSVGGYGSDLKHKMDLCKDSEVLSVRSQLIYDNFAKDNCDKIELNPDSAILLPKIFPISKLQERATVELPKEDYFFFQIKKNYGNNNLIELSKHLNELSEKLSLKVVLCPIGKAFKHEDQVPLKTLEKTLTNCQYMEPVNLFDVVLLLSNAKFYVGSSLHGAIISQAYNTPFFPLKIRKISDYIETWTNKRTYAVDELLEIPKDLNAWNFEEIKDKTLIQQQKAEDLILKILNL